MATMHNSYQPQFFRVIHPLNDAPETKCKSDGLGPIAMTPTVRIALKVLRGYLLLMSGMLVFHVLDIAGMLHGVK